MIEFCLSEISLKINCKQSTDDNPSRQHKACVSGSLKLYQCENKIMGVMFSIWSNIVITQVGGKINKFSFLLCYSTNGNRRYMTHSIITKLFSVLMNRCCFFFNFGVHFFQVQTHLRMKMVHYFQVLHRS